MHKISKQLNMFIAMCVTMEWSAYLNCTNTVDFRVVYLVNSLYLYSFVLAMCPIDTIAKAFRHST